jgi:hypothetical protein
MADALNVKPPMAIVAAANPIATLRSIMMLNSFAVSTPAFANQTHRL